VAKSNDQPQGETGKPAKTTLAEGDAKPAKKRALVAKAGKASATKAKQTAPKRRAVRGKTPESEPEEIADAEEAEETEGDSDREGGLSDHDGDVIEVTGELVDDEPNLDQDDESESEIPIKPRGRAAVAATGTSGTALSRTDPLQAYLREVQRHPLLTPDEEKQLTQHYYKTQDVRTAARLVTANLRLVVKLAYEYRRAYKNIMDLVQEGNIGLMQAVKRYDPYRGVKLSSYAAWWIRAYMLRFILNNWRLVKLGTTQAQRKLFFNLSKEKAKLSAMGIEPTAAEIARRLSVDEKEVVDMDHRMSGGEASLDAPAGDAEGRPIARVELMPSSQIDPEMNFERLEVGALVHDKLVSFRETLTGKDMIIFDKRMAAEEPLTLQELGEEFGISRERVRQLEARLATRLRNYLQEELGDAISAD